MFHNLFTIETKLLSGIGLGFTRRDFERESIQGVCMIFFKFRLSLFCRRFVQIKI
jgi:hypothetical protein